MGNVQLSEHDVDEMKQFYLEEFIKTSRRLGHIESVLKKLGIDDPDGAAGSIQESGVTPGKSMTTTRSGSAGRRKSGRKSKWEMLIMKRLRQLDRPVTYDELTDEIMASAKLPAEKKNSTKQAVVNVVFRLRSRDQKLDTFSMGTREKYIALRNWFSAPGEIKKEYKAKVVLPKSPARKRKRKTGKPAKKVQK
jgi:hypothetical protein